MSTYEPPEVRAASVNSKASRSRSVEMAGDTVRPVRIFHDQLQKQVEQIGKILTDCDEITICGIAGPALILALEKIAISVAVRGESLPWRKLHYVTPEPSSAFATRGDSGLGPVVRAWQSALYAVRSCIRQDLRPDQPIGPGVADQVELSVTPMMYMETIIRVIRDSHSEIWAAIGPHIGPLSARGDSGGTVKRADAAYLVLHSEHPLYMHLDSLVENFLESAKPYPLRMVTCPRIDDTGQGRLSEFACATGIDLTDELPVDGLRLDGLQPSQGASGEIAAACLPVAAVVVRAMTARGPVVVLRMREPGLDVDSFDKLSLLTGRIYEEDLASTIGVTPFFDFEEDAALEAMWRAADMEGPLCISVGDFVRAAQREIYACFGLDVSPTRFKLHGFQALDHESGDQNVFAVFELVLDSRSEFEAALSKRSRFESGGLFKVIRQSQLYSDDYQGKLNHLLEHRKDWMLKQVLVQRVLKGGR